MGTAADVDMRSVRHVKSRLHRTIQYKVLGVFMAVNICPELHSKIRERSQVSQSATEGQDLMLPVRFQVLESSGVALISVTGADK